VDSNPKQVLVVLQAGRKRNAVALVDQLRMLLGCWPNTVSAMPFKRTLRATVIVNRELPGADDRIKAALENGWVECGIHASWRDTPLSGWRIALSINP
jgi:hypothetical protein